MIGRKPEPIPGKTPGRWRVRAFCGVDRPNTWYVERENCGGVAQFPTWREAMGYADQQARTREVVLPRSVGSSGEPLGAPKLRTGVAYSAGEKTIWVEDRSVSAIEIRLDELQPLALTLLAMHYQQEVG